MQKLKWCLLCSAAADLFNKLMEKLLFFCLCFLCEACNGGLWMKAKSLNSIGHQQKSKAVDSKLKLTERRKNYPHFHGNALMCLAGAHPFALPQRILKPISILLFRGSPQLWAPRAHHTLQALTLCMQHSLSPKAASL